MGDRVTAKQFWSRLAVLERTAELHGSRFADDSPARRVMRMARAIVRPEAFNSTYLPHYFRSAPAPFHLELYRAMEADKRMVARAPRGHAKSTVVTFAYSLHQVVCAPLIEAFLSGRMDLDNAELAEAIRAELAQASAERGVSAQLAWDPYIQIVSVTVEQATEFTEAIKLELQTNELLRADFGELLPADDRQAAGDWMSQGVRVKAFGMRGNIRGGKNRQWRPTLCIVDDPDSEETVTSSELRDRQERKLTAAANYGLEPKIGRIFVLGTPVAADCLVTRLTSPDRFARWTKLQFKAIREDGQPLWPERWTLEALAEEEAEDPVAFAMEMMDTPPSTGRPFETLHYYDDVELEGLDLPKVLAFDPALGRTEKADFQALVVLVGPTPKGWYAVTRCELLRIGDPLALVRRVNAVAAEERPDIAVMETIGFQALLLALMASDPQCVHEVAWVRIDTQAQAKDLRIRGLAPVLNVGTIRVPRDRRCRALEHQALDYPHGKRDGLDVLEMAWRKARGGARPGPRDVRHGRRRAFGRTERAEARAQRGTAAA